MFSEAYKRYVLGALTIVFTLNSLDRVLINLVLQSIKEDLHLSDTQLGFLTGIAFGIFYSTLGIPIARWSDRGNRTRIVSLAIGLWGLTVMLCLFVGNFLQLVMARVAAAIGEAGSMPPSYSLLGDYFEKPNERTRAMTIYWLASPLAGLISFMIGGWISQKYGWRWAFFALGVPGLLAAVIVWNTVVEPRSLSKTVAASPGSQPGFRRVLSALWAQKSSRHLGIAIVLLYVMALGLGPWYAAFMIRSHGMSTSELGFWMGLIFGLSGIVGTALGGYASIRWFPHDERGQMRLTAIMTALLLPCFLIFLLTPGKYQALAALIPLMTVFCFFLGPTFALMQRLVPSEMRATTMAVVMLVANLVGMGIGPQIVGILSDLMSPTFGSNSLRYAMLIISIIALWASYHLWRVGNFVEADLSSIGDDDPVNDYLMPVAGPAA